MSQELNLLTIDACCDGGLDEHLSDCPLYGTDDDPEMDGVSPGRWDEYLNDD